MAVPGKSPEIRSIPAPKIVVHRGLTAYQALAAAFLARGMTQAEVVRRMVRVLVPLKDNRHLDRRGRLKKARRIVREWTQIPEFRDAIYELGLVEIDLESPNIMKAVVRSAKRGRVDAAKLAFELTGRHSTKETQPVAVNVVFEGLPRPANRVAIEAEVVEDDG